ncbi:hypothetical protein [Sporomusa aerivorans]|uniref:hypothetical protein n=1 Tax=Sporomusa aerivorans TaxID=204936 RepID=UPI00352AA7E8
MKKITVNHGLRPDFGLTTGTFISFIKSNETTQEQIIEWAYSKGFSWVEVRDPAVAMSSDYLQSIQELGRRLGLRLHYAWDTIDLLQPDDQLFYRGVENALVFGENTYSRVLAAPWHIKNVPDKKGYNQNEFKLISQLVEQYTQYAQAKGVVLCFENAFEPLRGDNCQYFGMSELLERIQDMNTVFDPGNYANQVQVRVLPSAEELLAFVRKYKRQIPYFHIKTTAAHSLLPYITSTDDYDMEALFREMAEVSNALFCLELPPGKTLQETQENIAKSIEFLQSSELVSLS